ncbi:MAG: COG1361 S-layer family protein [Haloferacaceae archaeon]
MSSTHSAVLVVAVTLLASVAGGAVTVGAQSSGDVVGQPVIEAFASGAEYEPGTESELRLVLSNEGRLTRGGPAQFEQRVTTARGTTVRVLDGGVPIDVTGDPVAAGEVPRGTTPLAPLEVTVSENATPGTYRLPVEVSYGYTAHVEYSAVESPEYDDFHRTERRYVTIRVEDGARFAVVGTNTTAQVGDEASLSVTLENVGTERARDARVELASPSDELRFGDASASSTAHVGRWRPGQRRTVEYTVSLRDGAALRDYTLEATVRYADEDGITRASEPLALGLSPSREQTLSLRTANATLRVGDEGRFAGTVVNEGPDAVRNPVVVFRSTGRNVDAETTEYALPDLAPGEAADFGFDVSVSEGASAGSRQFEVVVRYRNRRGDARESDALERRVRVRPQRDRLVVEPVDRRVPQGASTTLRVRVTNNGDEPLRDVEAKAFARDPLDSGDDEALIPTLAPGESAVIRIGLDVAGDAIPRKTYPVSLDFQYERPDGDTAVSRTYKVPVEVGPPADDGSRLPFGLAGVVALTLAVAGGVVVWRRRGNP